MCSNVTVRRTLRATAAAVLVVLLLVAAAVAAESRSGVTDPAGRKLYRQFCGKCHALTAALAAGFGSQHGLGELGGPSFNELRVPYSFSITAVTLPTGGHEVVKKKMTRSQVQTVARYIARVTQKNPVPAFPTDG